MADPQPYQAAAKAYVAYGWLGALPLPPREKGPVPVGYTGKQHFEVDPTAFDVDRWIAEKPGANIGLRMPRDVLGIDVDMYDGKPGRESLATAEEKWGPLPPTWMSSSRTDGSGIRFYRVPEGMKWPNTVGPGIETVHRGHRYAVAPPSIHPKTGQAYFWTQPDGTVDPYSIPFPRQLAELPEAWVVGLTSGEMDTGPTARANVDATTASAWLTAGSVVDCCGLVAGKLDEAQEALGDNGSRHDRIRDIVLALLFYGQQGHQGVHYALSTLQGAFLDAVASDRAPGQAEREWQSILAGGVAIVGGSPRPAENCRGLECNGIEPAQTPAGLSGPEWTVTPPSELRVLEAQAEEAGQERDFWDRRPELAHIKAFARSRMASPWATLGVALVRASCCIEPTIVLPPIIGGVASLNLFVGIVGKSGDGKGAAEAASFDAIRWPMTTEKGLGSGEGLVHVYVRHRPPKKDDPGGIEIVETRAIFRAPEVDTLAALKGRTGSTLLPKLRDAWIGDALGFAYASQEKALDLPAQQYRMGLVIGIQPERSSVLLDDEAGGTPQRFLWMPAYDPAAPDELPPEPQTWTGWAPPSQRPKDLYQGGQMMGGKYRIPICDIARQTIIDARRARLRGDGDALDGHALLCRLKVAAALSILARRLEVNEEDWELAGEVMAVSDDTRRGVQSALSAQREQADERRVTSDVRREEKREELTTSRLTRRIFTLLEAAGPEGLAASAMRRRISKPLREDLETVLEDMAAAGQISSEVFEYKGQSGTKYWLPEARA